MGPFPSLPGGMDLLFKNYFDSFRAKGTLPPELEGKVEAKLFTDMEKLDVWRNNFKGIAATFPEYNIFLKGAIDELLVADSGNVIVLDFKTRGFPTKEDSHTYYVNQLTLYTLLFEKNGYSVAPYAYLLFFWPGEFAEGKSSFNSDLVKVEVNTNEGKKILQTVSDIIEGPIPAANPSCVFCRYRNAHD